MSERVGSDKQRVHESSKRAVVPYACLRRGHARSFNLLQSASPDFMQHSMTKMTKLIGSCQRSVISLNLQLKQASGAALNTDFVLGCYKGSQKHLCSRGHVSG